MRGKVSEYTEQGLLSHELRKQKNHIPLRDLFTRAGKTLQQLMPCFMMSPLSVSEYLPPESVEFDVVIIDEASQMRPEDALGAISRAKQLVVVGDPKQLPPTSFFDRASELDEESQDFVDAESVLDLALQKFSYRRLLWHYRSRHAGLIAFSNHHFYENDLMIFPSPSTDFTGGVKHHYVDGVYNSSRNHQEAVAIVDAAERIVTEMPQLSIGIVAVNKPQCELIDNEWNLRVLKNAALQRYEAKWENTLSPFIIKNLESVQGDERDIILVSTVYGKDTRGSFYQRFPAINSNVGARRLNVLFTRARERLELFTSMRSTDIRIDEKSSKGLKTLQAYLEYAEHGPEKSLIQPGVRTNREPDSDFERSVARVLEMKGYKVVAQVGVAGFFIDIGIVHPDNSQKYIVGIECDGAEYHRTKSARDRDRLREEILLNLGWKLIRVWSTDWFSDPSREADRLVREIARLEKSDKLLESSAFSL